MADSLPQPALRRCNLGSLSLLVLVAMALSAGVATTDWAVVDAARHSAPAERQVCSHQTLTVERRRVRQCTRPDVFEARCRAMASTALAIDLQGEPQLAAPPMPVRVALTSLPPPAC